VESSKVIKFLIEIAPVISAIMPLIVILLTGWWVNKRLENMKSRLQLDHSIIGKRAEIYAEIQDDLNNIYSYIKRVGKWKELTPTKILESKRLVDQKFNTTKPYWSENTMNQYEEFMKVCFKTFRGHGKDAGIRASIERYKSLENWNALFNDSFVGGYDEDSLNNINKKLMKALSKDFGIV